MTRFARRAGVLADNSKGDVKKKEEGTSWNEMFKEGDERQSAGDETKKEEKEGDLNERKRKHQDDYEKRIEFENKSNRFSKKQEETNEEDDTQRSSKPASTSLENLIRRYEKSLDKEVIDDLVAMKTSGKITYEELADKLMREERSNRRRLDRIEERHSSQVCFKCRKSGHSIQDCPMIKGDNEQGTGICYKCGSTEHAVSRCKVKLEPGKYLKMTN